MRLRLFRESGALLCGLVALLGLAMAAPAGHAQVAMDPKPVRMAPGGWQDPAADSLVSRAIARRGRQLADSTLLSYRADAHGFLAFLAQLGEGVVIPPRVVQSEELALQIAWWQPGRSAQRLVGRRDTTLLPADVGYYRDRYGVVLDNLPDRIRLGDGQDVRDVPHPLGAAALTLYEYAMGRPLRIGLTGREILVDEVKFRPRNATLPGAIGSVYLDRETGAVVRLSMTFTRAAILDKRIETLVVTLENGLVRDRYWLPRRQEVEVSRGSTWFDIPARGIVRGRWEISNYDVNERIAPETMLLPRWSSAPRDSLRAHRFEGRVVDALPPEIQVASSEEVVRARVQAESAVRAAMLARPATVSVTGRGISDLVRITRAEGVAVGVGGAHKSATGLMLMGRARFGLGDRQFKGHVALGRAPAFGRLPTLQLFAERDVRDLGFAERAGVTNSLAAGLFSSDYTTQVDTRAAGVSWKPGPTSAFTWRVAAERDAPLAVNGAGLTRAYAPTLPAWGMRGARLEVTGAGGTVPPEVSARRYAWQLSASAGAFTGTSAGTFAGTADAAVPSALSMMPAGQSREVRPLVARAQAQLQITQPLAGDRAVFLQTMAGVANGRDLPPQWLVFAGGPWSAPGYAWHGFASRALLSQRVELRLPVPAPSVPLRRFGASPPRATLAPFVQAVAVASGTRERPTVAGVYPSAGVSMLFFFDLLRADVARGLRQGGWRFAIDIDRSFWGML
jgi:hypothetical protein